MVMIAKYSKDDPHARVKKDTNLMPSSLTIGNRRKNIYMDLIEQLRCCPVCFAISLINLLDRVFNLYASVLSLL